MSHVTFAWVMSHLHESCHICMSHVTFAWFMSHLHESCYICISHVTFELDERVKSHAQNTKIKDLKTEIGTFLSVRSQSLVVTEVQVIIGLFLRRCRAFFAGILGSFRGDTKLSSWWACKLKIGDSKLTPLFLVVTEVQVNYNALLAAKMVWFCRDLGLFLRRYRAILADV